MDHFNDMTAISRIARSQSATLVRNDEPWIDFAVAGIALHCGWSSALGGAG
jgi:hypothetical protein